MMVKNFLSSKGKGKKGKGKSGKGADTKWREPCKNGKDCPFLKKGKCWRYHPKDHLPAQGFVASSSGGTIAQVDGKDYLLIDGKAFLVTAAK
jgi:hypothetical protein